MQKISPFVWFDNNGEEAMNFYLSIFKNAKLVRESRIPPGGPGKEGDFLVATIELEGQEIVNYQVNNSSIFTSLSTNWYL